MDAHGLVGQLFTVDFDGLEPSPDVARLIADGGVGGITLFTKNVGTPGQVAGLTNGLQRLAAAAGRPPLLVSMDQEGGAVVRLRGTEFPSAMGFGAADDDALTAQAAAVTARELRAVGVHINFAPALDVNSNPANPVIGTRSYGEDPARVARLGVRAITAMQAAGVLATAKHFPGHGDTFLDSHLALPTVRHPRHRLEEIELRPFREAVRAGVAAVMTAHVLYPALDPELPATLSPAILAFLRGEMGFGGLVFTDSMQMRAIADRHRPGEAAVQAVRAGVDVVLALGATEALWEALRAVRAAVDDGRISAARVQEAAGRVLAAKRQLGLLDHALVSESDVARNVGRPEDRALADAVAAAAATIVRDPAGLIPLTPGAVLVATDLASGETVDRLLDALRAAGRQAAAASVTGTAGAARAPAAGAVVVPIGRATEGNAQAARVREVTSAATRLGPSIAVATDVPYPLAWAAPECACLAVYGNDPASLTAAARVLAGTGRAGGRLPVTVSAPANSP